MNFAGIDTPPRRSVKSLILVVGLASIAAMSAARANEPDFSPPLPPIASLPQASQLPLATQVPSATDNVRTVNLTVGEGDSLASMLGQAGVGAASKAAALTALGDLFDPMDLRPGAAVQVVLETQGQEAIIRSLHLETGTAEDLTVYVPQPTPARQAGPANTSGMAVYQVSGEVGASFHNSLLAANLSLPLVEEALLALTNDPDLPAGPPPSARFKVVYLALSATSRGRGDEFRYIEIDDGQKVHRVYRYRLDDVATAIASTAGTGEAMIDFVLPLKRAEVTSPFGWRIHPVFKDRRFHKGVDFRAPKGTPVSASAEGVVVDVGWRGNYGRIIRVRHQANVETTYSHLSGFARGLYAGKKVKQGQVIGYVGRTGVATGYHLYYEILVDGKHVNPLDPPAVFNVRFDSHQLSALKDYLGRTATLN
ncbi:MAG: M23 family metallopeptidase [Rhodospirillales bacterium]|nr:M23 family metallopeptidase [Rhodospirillales bacterium]